MIYPILRKAFFKMAPEKAHYFAMNRLKNICGLPGGRALVSALCAHQDPKLKTSVFGIDFRNPIGLGAGFDKNALYLRELEALGFGSVEIGTVTPKGQPGNPQPRLFRLPADQALINRMGFNNDGAPAVRERLENWREKHDLKNGFIIGGNIGKNKITENEDAWKDYLSCFKTLFEAVDYFTVNVSSPNTPGLRALQEKDSLRRIFTEIQTVNQGKNTPKPVLLKIAPDLNEHQLADILQLATEINLSGIVATNTTISRAGLKTPEATVTSMGAGGLSGRPVKARATEVMEFLIQGLPASTPVIASGGIFTPSDAQSRLKAGARLVQVWTGFIYEGPAIAGKICKQLG
ncbi:quinone-dependent dihydroorotate dehydrogenase [Arachidicoccus ginsenosidivorans]